MLFFAACIMNLSAQAGGSAASGNQTVAEQSFENNTNYFNSSENTAGVTNGISGSTNGIFLFIRMIFVLIFVIALIYGVLWFIKNKTNAVKTDDEFLRRASYINIAPGKSVEVITLIDRAYLIGVTEDSMTLLGEINPSPDAEKDRELINALNLRADQTQNTKKPLNFGEVLNMFLAKGNKTENVFSETEQQVENLFNQTSAQQTENEDREV